MSSWKFKKWANTRITIARELCCLKARGILIDFKVPKTRLGFYVSCNRHRVYFINVYIYIYYYYNRLKITILFYYQVLGDNPFLSKRCLCISSLHTSTWLLHESTVMNHLLCCRQNKNTVMFLIYGIIPSRRNYYEIVVFWLYLKSSSDSEYTIRCLARSHIPKVGWYYYIDIVFRGGGWVDRRWSSFKYQIR